MWSNFICKLAYPSLYSFLQKTTKQVLMDLPSVRSRGYDQINESVTEFLPVCFQFHLQPWTKHFCIVFCLEAVQCQGWQQSQLLTCCLKHVVSTSWAFNLTVRFCFDEVRPYKVVNSCWVSRYFSRDAEEHVVIHKPKSLSDLFFGFISLNDGQLMCWSYIICRRIWFSSTVHLLEKWTLINQICLVNNRIKGGLD